ncbi:MAG: rod shape-determining protein MreC [Sedimentisphaerales bacterium]|nr:rod shape-determining protein MreC [Sedimentisphaerales bacterium]
MAIRNNRVPDRVLFISLFLTGLIFLFAPQKITGKFQFAYVRIFCWPLSIGRDISLSAYGLMASAEGSEEDVISRIRYDKLHNRLANVTEWLRQERQKVETLSGLRNRTAWQGVKFVLADIITSTIDGLHSELIINRGSQDGLVVGQFVMADESIIGTVCKVDNRTARVRLITDPASQIAVKIEGLNKDRILQGTGNDSAEVKLLPTKYRVEVDEVVYAQKKPGFLSTPIIVGTVAQCESNKDNPLLWDITVKPACDIANLTEVSVLVMNPL